jgi:hypothetical protein
MIEAEWLACRDPMSMMKCEATRVSKRKQRLFAVACCRRIAPLMTDAGRRAVAAAEAFADGGISAAELYRAWHRVGGNSRFEYKRYAASAAYLASTAPTEEDADGSRSLVDTLPEYQRAVSRLNRGWLRCDEGRLLEALVVVCSPRDPLLAARNAFLIAQCSPQPAAARAVQTTSLRDIFGNPFQLVVFSQAWGTDTALSLARTMYEPRDFTAMPILADALQEAGCDSDDILNHCRSDGVPVRGCWAFDLVLGKS